MSHNLFLNFCGFDFEYNDLLEKFKKIKCADCGQKFRRSRDFKRHE